MLKQESADQIRQRCQSVTLQLSTGTYDYLYDPQSDTVYTHMFPGVEVQKFTLQCGHTVHPSDLKMVVKHKLQQLQALSELF